EQPSRVRVSRDFRTRCGEKDECVTIGLLDTVYRSVIADRPEIPAEILIAMALPKKIHSVIDNHVSAWPPHQMGDRISVHDPCRREKIARWRSSSAITRS